MNSDLTAGSDEFPHISACLLDGEITLELFVCSETENVLFSLQMAGNGLPLLNLVPSMLEKVLNKVFSKSNLHKNIYCYRNALWDSVKIQPTTW